MIRDNSNLSVFGSLFFIHMLCLPLTPNIASKVTNDQLLVGLIPWRVSLMFAGGYFSLLWTNAETDAAWQILYKRAHGDKASLHWQRQWCTSLMYDDPICLVRWMFQTFSPAAAFINTQHNALCCNSFLCLKKRNEAKSKSTRGRQVQRRLFKSAQ